MKFYCIHCFSDQMLHEVTPLHALCHQCLVQLEKQKVKALPANLKLTPLRSLFEYETMLRTIILRAKIKSDHQALGFLENMFCQNAHALKMGLWSDVVMAAPSSLWGRWRGRLDLAYALAAALAKAVSRPLVPAPNRAYWRLFKRAQMLHRAEQPPPLARELKMGQPQMKRRRVLLIDDVVTTGLTLRETAALPQLGQDQVRFLTLAVTMKIQNVAFVEK